MPTTPLPSDGRMSGGPDVGTGGRRDRGVSAFGSCHIAEEDCPARQIVRLAPT